MSTEVLETSLDVKEIKISFFNLSSFNLKNTGPRIFHKLC